MLERDFHAGLTWNDAEINDLYTREHSQVVTHLQTSYIKRVHKLLTPCVRTVCPKLLEQVCNKLDETIRLVTRLFQKDSHD